MRDIYFSAGRAGASADVVALDACRERDIDKRVEGLQVALHVYKESKEHAAAAKATEEQIRLLLLQRQIETEVAGVAFVGLSISATLYELYKADQLRLAAKISKEFKVPEKRLVWIRIQALADVGDWGGLELVAKEKKSPIGYEPFVQVCIDKSKESEARKYVPRVANAERRANLFLQLKMFREAAQLAQELKSLDLLQTTRNAAIAENDRQGVAYVDSVAAEMQK